MTIHCKKTGEEYEISDREIGEKVECPCCGEKFVVDDLVISDGAYTAALIRKTEAIMLRNEPKQKLYKHGTESSNALLFDRAYELEDADAQFQLAKWLYDNERAYPLATFWFGRAAAKKHPEATCRFAECLWNGIGVRKDINRAVEEYRNAAKYGCDAAKDIADKFDFAEYKGCDGGGKATFAEVQKVIGDGKKFEEQLCAKYSAQGVALFWLDEALPEWGTPKGTSIIIGSFKSEKDVPREMLKEIAQLIGRRLSYSGRYVNDEAVGEEKFAFCYVVMPNDEECRADTQDCAPEGKKHVSDFMQQALDEESGETERRAIIWRETIDMNCPLCEGKITLPTQQMGSRVCCPHCNLSFFAKGEGIMTTAERKAYREFKMWSNEASNIEQDYMRAEGGLVTALRLAFNMRRYSIEQVSVGSGDGYPWPGVYIVLEFADGDDSRLVNVRKTLESGLGFWVLLTNSYSTFGNFYYRFYIRKDRPCEQNANIRIDIEQRIEQRKAKIAISPVPKDIVLPSKDVEYERLKYLIYGEYEPSRNHFDFQKFMRSRHHVVTINIFNDDKDGLFYKRLGFKEGFGIVVETTEVLKDNQFALLVDDLEKRTCRKMTFIKKVSVGSDIQYSFVPSVPLPQITSTSSSQLRATTKKTQTRPMQMVMKAQNPRPRKKMTLDEVEHKVGEVLGKYRVPALVGIINPYCYNVCVPFDMADSTTVIRAFNDMFHTFGVLAQGKTLAIGDVADYCEIYTEDGAYYAPFNDPIVLTFSSGDTKYQYVMKEMRQRL